MPVTLSKVILSFRNMAARNTEKIGDEQVPINAMLMAEVVCAAMYKNVLKMVTPKSDVQKKYCLFCRMIFRSWDNCLNVKGSNINVPNDQRKKDNDMGGTSLMKALATIKLPLQIIQASIAKAMPM